MHPSNLFYAAECRIPKNRKHPESDRKRIQCQISGRFCFSALRIRR